MYDFGHANVGRDSPGGALGYTGGMDFFGNMYQGRVNAEDYTPPQAHSRYEQFKTKFTFNKTYADDDPVIRAKIDRCPYFALSDMVVWHGMAPTFLDPGLLTTEEHHLLLLHSRMYYEKWTEIHAKPRECAPKIRIKYGRFSKTSEILDYIGVPAETKERLAIAKMDDASLIGMNPNLWATAHLDAQLRDQLTGRVFTQCDVTEHDQELIFALLDRMRTLVVHRRDTRPEQTIEIPYSEITTLWDLHKLLGLDSYSGQIKCYNWYDEGARKVISMGDEDNFFDFKIYNFYKANIRALGNFDARAQLTVESNTRAESALGSWF